MVFDRYSTYPPINRVARGRCGDSRTEESDIYNSDDRHCPANRKDPGFPSGTRQPVNFPTLCQSGGFILFLFIILSSLT